MLIGWFAEHDHDALRQLSRATWRDAYATRLGPDAAGATEDSLESDAAKSMVADDGGCFVAIVGPETSGSRRFAEREGVAEFWACTSARTASDPASEPR